MNTRAVQRLSLAIMLSMLILAESCKQSPLDFNVDRTVTVRFVTAAVVSQLFQYLNEQEGGPVGRYPESSLTARGSLVRDVSGARLTLEIDRRYPADSLARFGHDEYRIVGFRLACDSHQVLIDTLDELPDWETMRASVRKLETDDAYLYLARVNSSTGAIIAAEDALAAALIYVCDVPVNGERRIVIFLEMAGPLFSPSNIQSFHVLYGAVAVDA